MDNIITINIQNQMRANEMCKIFKIARSNIDGWVRKGIFYRKKI